MRVSLKKDVLIRQVGSESVILNLNSEHYFGLDDVGTSILTALTTSDTLEAAFDQVLAEYDVDAAALRLDFDRLVQELVTNGLIELNDESSLAEIPYPFLAGSHAACRGAHFNALEQHKPSSPGF